MLGKQYFHYISEDAVLKNENIFCLNSFLWYLVVQEIFLSAIMFSITSTRKLAEI